MNQKVIRDDSTNHVVVVDQFKGYTLKDLKYQRAITKLRKQYAKEQVQLHLNNLKPSKIISDVTQAGSSFGLSQAVAIATGSKNPMNYVSLGMALFRGVKKIAGFFIKKK